MHTTPSLTTVVTLAESLAALSARGGLSTPCLVHVTDGEVGLQPVLDRHPLDAVVGLLAPPEWTAFGVVAEAWATPLGTIGPPEPPGEAVLVHLVDRLGSSHTILSGRDGSAVADATAGGPLADACRRALGLGTGPCRGSDELWASLWLDTVLSSAAAGRLSGRSQWQAVVELHPFVRILGGESASSRWADPADASPSQVTEWGRLLARFLPWPVLRNRARAGRFPAVPELTPEQVDWFDDASFGRYVVAAYPHWTDLRADLDPLLTAVTAGRIDEVLSAWELGSHGH
jgi:hypothetical protein